MTKIPKLKIRKGVRKFPIISTIFDFETDRKNTTTKKIIEKRTALNCGKMGFMPISKVAAAVRGIATNGPIHNIMSNAKMVTINGFTFRPRSVNEVPKSTTVSTPKNGEIIPVVKKPAIAANHSLPDFSPIKGGKIKLPAPKNMAKRAKPKVTAVPNLFFKVAYFTVEIKFKKNNVCL